MPNAATVSAHNLFLIALYPNIYYLIACYISVHSLCVETGYPLPYYEIEKLGSKSNILLFILFHTLKSRPTDMQ